MSARGDWRDGLSGDTDRVSLPAIERVQHDSRLVEPGDLFVCVPGLRVDGHDFAAAAVGAGAAALVAEHARADALRALGVPVVDVPSARRALSAIAAAHEGYPSERLTVVGVTGTNGKTTTTLLIQAALEAYGESAGLISTVETRVGGTATANATRMSTPEAPEVQRLLADMVDAGDEYAVVEATSHGLALDRLVDIAFDVAVLTNLGEDHLDFHGTVEAYAEAKLRLFAQLDAPTSKRVERRAVLNADDPAWRRFAAATRAPALTYGIDATDADVVAGRIESVGDGSTFELQTPDAAMHAQVRLPGRFNISNAAAAFAASIALGIDPWMASVGISQCAGVPGRFERIMTAPIGVVVDYAHTGHAFAEVLSLLRALTDGRLIVVFGAAGERPSERRRGMGAVAARQADYAVLTEEDPRSEPPEAIIDEIARAMIAAGAEEGSRFERVPDRREAIAKAIGIAEFGDVVLVAGKGHEPTIERADGPHPWDDRRVAREVLMERFSDPDEWE
ncbi:MAG: UDP-N-acetylmuramoyl-L-alanyl-D-glutamate--2,6-diaminopimelate ligase [Chloroflexi bacterium]|nr:UDP-N-acetylmuramoyl-L-alanyl-D-glutamate--2,6-diaminopimelate ligase [Chloroflexota bacterium]